MWPLETILHNVLFILTSWNRIDSKGTTDWVHIKVFTNIHAQVTEWPWNIIDFFMKISGIDSVSNMLFSQSVSKQIFMLACWSYSEYFIMQCVKSEFISSALGSLFVLYEIYLSFQREEGNLVIWWHGVKHSYRQCVRVDRGDMFFFWSVKAQH